MCMGKSKSSAPQTIPPPTPPTKFEYVNADTTNQQRRAATTNAGTNAPTDFGSDLGAATPTTAGAM